MDAELEIKKVAQDRAASIATQRPPSSLLASLLTAKTRYAAVMTRLVRSHQTMAHDAMQEVKKRRIEEFRGRHFLKGGLTMSAETKVLSQQQQAMDIGRKEFQSFFKRPFTKEEVAKEMSGEATTKATQKLKNKI